MNSVFYGREKDVAWLSSEFDECAKRDARGKFDGPRMAFVIAESGIGKTRLVQELSLQLANSPKWDPSDYWPGAFGDDGTKLLTVPDMEGHRPKGPPHFVWLGARFQSPDERNPLGVSVVPDLQSTVMTHAKIINQYKSVWQDAKGRVVRTVKHEAREEVIGFAVEKALSHFEIPFIPA